LIAGNWKMFKGPRDAQAFFGGFDEPDGVDVVMRRCGDIGRHCLAAVECLVKADAAEVHRIGVAGVDVDLAEIHRPRIGVVHFRPGCAAVF